MAILEVRGLVKYYGRRKVVGGVDYDVDVGEVVGLLGPNGAGKTTSFRMTTGQIEPNAGRVTFDGQDVTGLPMYRRARLGLGYLSQEKSVFRKLTVEQNILAVLEAMPVYRSLGRRLTRKERYEKTDQVLEKFGLTHLRKNNAARLSGGETRRLEIARCLVCDPLLILLDEPFTGIDPQTIEDIQQIVRSLRDQGIGILVTDHRVREVLMITDRSYLIKGGLVRAHGTPQQIVRNPVAISEYLGNSMNRETFQQTPSQLVAGPPVTMPPPAAPVARSRPGEAIHAVVEQERIRRLIDRLPTPDQARAAAELVDRGAAAVPALLEALERRDVEVRRLAYEVLRQVAGGAVPFDPLAPEPLRRQQLALLRERWGRKAG
jgi:lipopolysaccharide export system ATP-binding protein